MSNRDDSEERERYFQELAEEAAEKEREAYRYFYHQACENFDLYWQEELSTYKREEKETDEEYARRLAELAYFKGLEER